MTDLEAYRQPSIAVDLVILTVIDCRLCTVVLPRDDLARGAFALPGGFVRYGQSLDETVRRVLAEKTGFTGITFEQLATYGDPSRDPRGHVLSIVYLAMLPQADLPRTQLVQGALICEVIVDWPGESGGPAKAFAGGRELNLSFDHAVILGDTVKRLRGKLNYSQIAFSVLPVQFTLRQVQEVHEAILGRQLLKPAFRRKLLDRGILRQTGQMETGSAYRPAALFELIQPTVE
jgi:8-oxo-dGTP diphosphatase